MLRTVLSFLPALLFLILHCREAHAQDRVKIGVSVPLSGEGAVYGEDIRDFLRFANRDLAQDKYELIFEDDKCNAKDAITAAHKLLGVDKVPYVIGFACSSTILGPAQMYERAKVAVIVVFASSPKIRHLGPHIFRTYPNDAEAGRLLADYMRDRHKTVAVLSEQTDYAQDLKEAFSAQIAGGKVQLITEDYLPQTADFRTVLNRLKAKGAEALFVNPQVERTYAIIMQQLTELNWSPQVYGAYWPGSPSVLEVLGEKSNGIVYADTPGLADLLSSEGAAVLARYKSNNGQIRSTEAVFATVYEGFRALDEAIRSQKDVTEYLSQGRWKGLFGEWSFDQDGEISGISLILKQIVQGKPQRIS